MDVHIYISSSVIKHISSGSATLSPNRRIMAVLNLTSRNFDVYNSIDMSKPSMSLSVSSNTRLIKQSAFAEEDARVLVCGGDEGLVYVFDVSTGACSQRLEHDDGKLQLR